MGIYALAYGKDITLGEAVNISITGFVVVLLILALLAVLVLLLSKGIRLVESFTGKRKTTKGQQPQSAGSTPTAAASPLPENADAGRLDVYDVDEKTAAVIMAIVSNESGIPLNRLLFKSIKRIEK